MDGLRRLVRWRRRKRQYREAREAVQAANADGSSWLARARSGPPKRR